RLLAAVFEGWIAAYREANALFTGPPEYIYKKFSSHEAHYCYPHIRKGLVDRKIRDAGKTFSAVSEPRMNRTQSSSHTVLAYGPFVLTAHHVDHSDEIVRYGGYRVSYFHNSLPLFPELDDSEEEQGIAAKLDEQCYAYLIYGNGGSTDERFPV